MKYKVLERGTGKKSPDEWLFLREDWKFHLEDDVQFDKHFAFLAFDRPYTSNAGPGDRLILNLLTRKQFWLSRREIIERISEKAAHILGLGEFRISMGARLHCYNMCVGNNEIITKYWVYFYVFNLDETHAVIGAIGDDVPLLGWFSNSFNETLVQYVPKTFLR